MSGLAAALAEVLKRPDPAALVGLQEALLADAPAGAARSEALLTAGEFHSYLLDLRGRLTARQFSELASWLDVAAMGLVAFEGFVAGQSADLVGMATGLLAEGVMVVASRQHIKAWEAEAEAAHDRAAWHLRGAYWRLSEAGQPDLAPAERLRRLRLLVAPAESRAVSSAKILLLGQLFQILLLVQTIPLLGASQPEPEASS